MGYQTHHRSLRPRKKHAAKRSTLDCGMPSLLNRSRRQGPHPMMPLRKRKDTMETEHADTVPVAERPRHSYRNSKRNHDKFGTVGHKRHNTQPFYGRLLNRTGTNRLGQNVGWVDNKRMARPPRPNLETRQVTQIEPPMDIGPYPKTVGCVMGHVGSPE